MGIYRSPSANVELFLEKMEHLLSSKNSNIIIGDFNFDLLKDNTTTSRYTDLIQSQGHLILNKLNKNHATRETPTTKTIIDHLITDCFKYAYQITLSDTSLSDHKQISINITIDHPTKRNSTTKYYKVIDYEKIERKKLLDKLNTIENVDKLILSLTEIITTNTKTITLKNECTKRKTWMTNRNYIVDEKKG